MEFTPTLVEKVSNNSLYNTFGIKIERAGEGKVTSRLDPEPAICWPTAGQPHGGVLFTLMDTTMAWAVITGLPEGYSCSTVNLDIQYPHMAKGEFFTCEAWIVHQTKRSSFARADIRNPEGILVAMAHGTFRVFKSDALADMLTV